MHVITADESGLGRKSLLGHWVRRWREQGIRVTVGPTDRLEADLGIMHVDLTRVPPGCVPENPLGRPLLNASVLDISKRVVSRNLVYRDSAVDGAVILKTDANCFGGREFHMLPRLSSRRLRRKLAGWVPWQWVRELPRGTYPVLPTVGDVPAWVWSRDDLVVERFLPEIEDGAYVLRSWLFFGDRDYVVKLYGELPVVKAGSVLRHKVLDSVPQALRDVRAAMRMDLGKFDYVEVDGEVVLIDVNKTPTAALQKPGERLMSAGDGLFSFAGRSHD